MAKKIKFPLEMKDGVMVRTLEELKANFDNEKLIGHWLSGKLKTWLKDRHYDSQLVKINAIDASSKTVLVELCKALEISIDITKNQVQVDEITKRQKKIQVIRQYIDDKDIIEHIDNVAMNQTELEALLHRKVHKIYIFGERYIFNEMSLKNVLLIGINSPTIKIETDSIVDFNEMKVQFQGCKFDYKYLELLEKKQIEEEYAYKKNRKDYKVSSTFFYMISIEDQIFSKKLYNNVQEEISDFEFDIDSGTKKMYRLLEEADIYDIFNIDQYGGDIKDVIEKAKLNNAWEKFLNRLS